MRHSTYKTLPLDALYDLLTDAVRKLLTAYDTNNVELKEFESYKKEVAGFLTLIEEKKKSNDNGNHAANNFPDNHSQ